jgi:hypothetical protein
MQDGKQISTGNLCCSRRPRAVKTKSSHHPKFDFPSHTSPSRTEVALAPPRIYYISSRRSSERSITVFRRRRPRPTAERWRDHPPLRCAHDAPPSRCPTATAKRNFPPISAPHKKKSAHRVTAACGDAMGDLIQYDPLLSPSTSTCFISSSTTLHRSKRHTTPPPVNVQVALTLLPLPPIIAISETNKTQSLEAECRCSVPV